ncbi:hypothetical protein L9H26_06610 [Morganella psychrotolerans]|uniref:Uncharacterized protein n=1 Tax=Morganella psychrotolerans TaxID=368603 RepID=A0A5M9RAB2_9GAMM|nr:hypothetical protein [Morganella psychrotolerans]KAA8716998.1 hypothetical protein F4V73_03750 [Morganella psychrotolerans]OBU08676.1 hypothetical protein AYY16_05280 [Morganella psychrotolerans]
MTGYLRQSVWEKDAMIADRRGLLIRAGKKDSFLPAVGASKNPEVRCITISGFTKLNNKTGIFNYFIH